MAELADFVRTFVPPLSACCQRLTDIDNGPYAYQPTEVVRLAKRKVEDLEELEAPAAEMASGGAAAQCTPEEVAQGTEALKKFLLDWSQSKGDEGDGGSMDDTERQVKRLKTCVSGSGDDSMLPWLLVHD